MIFKPAFSSSSRSMPASMPARRALPILMSSLMLWTALPNAHAASAPAGVASEAPAATDRPGLDAVSAAPIARVATPPAGSRNYQVTLKQLGANYPLNLRGIDGSNSVLFNVRSDEIVTSARLRLSYTYSPALLADLSHINVLVNGEVAASIPVPKETAGENLQRVVDIPARLITEFNRISLQLIGHYTMQCEDPLHSSLWANISNNSVLDLTVLPIALPDDLAMLPRPFFDRRDVRDLNLPVIFAGKPDNAALEAAGAMSSWFGALAEYRGARFPVAFDAIPQEGNAIVMVAGNGALDGLDLPSINGPTVTVVTNPNDPNGKLLVMRGRDSAELKLATRALTTSSQTLSGESASFTSFTQLTPRKPYDAPNWLRSDRPVAFGELVSTEALNVSGYSPDLIRINTRIPPDLFGWREPGVAVNLQYRYTPQPSSENSSLITAVDEKFVKTLPLLSLERMPGGADLAAKVQEDDTMPMRAKFHLPLYTLIGESQVQFRYMYDYIKQGECRDIIIDNVRGAIDPSSTFDISNFDHFIAMPDLGAFQSAGFPFTRLADLSETAVILPDNAGEQEYTAYLGLMGRMGESTGYPATAVTVTQAQAVDSVAAKDLLVIGSGKNQPLAQKWNNLLPTALEGPSKRFGVSDMVYRATTWLNPNPNRNALPTTETLAFTSDGANAVFAGFESPLTPGRSVVMVSANQTDGLSVALDALIGGEDFEKGIGGSLAVVRGNDVQSLVANQTYYVGKLGFIKHVRWFMSENLPVFILASALGALLLILALYLALRRRARIRLTGE